MRTFKYIIYIFLTLGIVGVLGLALWGKTDFDKGQQLSRENLSYPLIFVDRNGKEFYRMFGNENREWAKLDEIPEILKEVTLLAEDRRFYHHFGVDLLGISRAMFENFKAGQFKQGGSTLTQQLVKKMALSDEKKLSRKFHEMFMAFGVEYRYSKNEILELYLNTVPYGARINGVKLAAQIYFKKDLKDITEAEALVLAVMPKNPVYLSRVSNVENWLGCEDISNCTLFLDNYKKSRIEQLLLALGEKHKWSPEKVLKIWNEIHVVTLQSKKNWVNSDFQHFQFYVRKFLEDSGFNFTSLKDGVVVQTSLDMDLQTQYYNYLRNGPSAELLTKHNIENFSVIVLDNKTRGPLVWIGSKYFWNQAISGQIDMLQAPRQTGSVIKPFIYAALFEAGFEPPTILYDSPTSFKGAGRTLQNADLRYMGGIRITDALAKSRNIPAVKALILAGGEQKVRKFLDEKFGFHINKDYKNHFFGWTLSLGTASVKFSDLANAYATLATTQKKDLCPIISITTFSGKSLSTGCNKALADKVIKDSTSFFISDILSNIQARPTDWDWRKNLTIDNFNIAAKTGTSSKRLFNGELRAVDDVVVGYTPNNTFLMWGGNTNGKALNDGSVSIIAIAKHWKQLVTKFYKKNPTQYAKFKQPEGLIKIQGEWANADYNPPSYKRLSYFLTKNAEYRLNPFNKLKKEKPLAIINELPTITNHQEIKK